MNDENKWERIPHAEKMFHEMNRCMFVIFFISNICQTVEKWLDNMIIEFDIQVIFVAFDQNLTLSFHESQQPKF